MTIQSNFVTGKFLMLNAMSIQFNIFSLNLKVSSEIIWLCRLLLPWRRLHCLMSISSRGSYIQMLTSTLDWFTGNLLLHPVFVTREDNTCYSSQIIWLGLSWWFCAIRAMGFQPEFFTVLFAIPRMAGYLAHWRESLDDPDTKIMRPQQVISFL